MPCRKPLSAYRTLDALGEKNITFKQDHPDATEALALPCGQCISCRLEKSRQWAIRCTHEAKLHAENCFITLTYSPDNIPDQGSLDKKAIPGFIKRLRSHIAFTTGQPSPRYYYCGEYGENLSRPHYHVCLFGYSPPDKKYLKHVNGNNLYTSELFDRLWKHQGHIWIGNLTFESAAYTARYCTKKITGGQKSEHYQGKEPEFANMSRRPAIGLNWIKKHFPDVYPSDEVIVRGKVLKPSRYYDKFMEKYHPEELDETKLKREEYAHLQLENAAESSLERMNTKHEIQLLRMKDLKRDFEHDATAQSESFRYDRLAVEYNKLKIKELKNET